MGASTVKPKTQLEIDQKYRARQLAKGIVRKAVQVPINRWPELQGIVKKMRESA